MNSYNSAINKLKRNNISIKSEIISIKDSLNRVLAKDVISPANYPICDNTAFDGYAVNSRETNSLNIKKSNHMYAISLSISEVIFTITIASLVKLIAGELSVFLVLFFRYLFCNCCYRTNG